MKLTVELKKKLGGFSLETAFETEGERLALLGGSGCGKSVTLRCIAGVLTPDEGRITLGDRVLYDSAARIDLPPQRRRVGYLFQQYALFPNMTVRQNVAAALPRSAPKEEAEELLRRFRLEEVSSLRPRQISGGQQQRTALARILASRPEVLLLDEPFSALDSYLKYQLELELAQVLDRFPGQVVWVSHDRGEVFRNCRRVCVMDRGKSQPARTMEELFRDPETEAAARLSGCKNYADAVPEGNEVALPEWKLTLDCGRPVPADVRRFGIRAHHVRLGTAGEKNCFSCSVLRVIEDVFSTVVLLLPEGAAPEAPPLRMELEPTVWSAVPDKTRIYAAIRPEEILLLR